MAGRRFPAPKPKYTAETAAEPKEKPPKAIVGDPAGDDSYQSMKNRLWNIYQGKYYPAFMKFRNEVTMHVLEIGRNPTANRAKSVKGIAISRQEYIETASDAFSEYMRDLTMSYINDKAHSQGIDIKEAGARTMPSVTEDDMKHLSKNIKTRAESKQQAKKNRIQKKESQ